MKTDNEFLYDEDSIRDALRIDVEAAEETNRNILEKRAKPGAHAWQRILPAAAAVGVLLVSGIGIGAAAAGRQKRQVRGMEDNRTYTNDPNTELLEEVSDDPHTESVTATFGGDGEYGVTHRGSADQTSIRMALIYEVDGCAYYLNPNAHVKEFYGETTEDLYYAVRESFLSFMRHTDAPQEVRQMVIEDFRAYAAETDIEAIRDALLAVISDYENGREMLIRRCWTLGEDGEPHVTSWVCEDVTDIADEHYLLFVTGVPDSIYGREADYWIEICDGQVSAINVFPADSPEELQEKFAGLPIYDRRK